MLLGCADNKIRMFDVNSQMCLWDVNAEKSSKYSIVHQMKYLFHCYHYRKVVSLACSPSGSKFVYATSSTASTGGSRLSAMYLVQSWRPQDAKVNTGTLAVLDMKSNAKEVIELAYVIVMISLMV